MLWSQYKLATKIHTEFLRKKIYRNSKFHKSVFQFSDSPDIGISKKIQPESLESKMELEFCSRWGSKTLEPKIGIPNQALNTTVDTEPILYLPSDPHSCPFDLSFDPYPASPPLTSHGCTSTTVGTNITSSSLPPKFSIIPSSPDVLQIIMANADSHLQKCECRKLGRINKTDTSTYIITRGNTKIGDLLHQIMLLNPFAIDPLGSFSPLLQHFLLGHHPAPLIRFPPSRPNATQMYTKLLQYPSPKGIFLLANHNWSLHPTQHFYGHSYLAPTPSITTV
jgi:hypothetical protein